MKRGKYKRIAKKTAKREYPAHVKIKTPAWMRDVQAKVLNESRSNKRVLSDSTE